MMLTNQQCVALLVAFWALLYLADQYLRLNTRWRSWYRHYITERGLTIHFFRLQWYSRYFNNFFLRIGQRNPAALMKWFDIGVIATLITTVLSIGFLTMIPVNTLLRSQKAEEQVLKPVIPGVNLPSGDIGFYLITLFFSAVLHEMGHAVAAVCENVKINGFGMFLLVLYPGAFVDMHTESLYATSAWKQLRIFCAGVWHNLVIVFIGLAVLFTAPSFLSSFYSLHEKVVVIDHASGSTVQGPSGFLTGDVITSIDNCTVSSVMDWTNCIVSRIESNHTFAHCVPADFLSQSDNEPLIATEDDCSCGKESNLLCYYGAFHQESQPFCLRARDVSSYPLCDNTCDQGTPDSTHTCVKPMLEHMDTGTKLLIISREQQQSVLFLGHPAELHQSLILGEVLPKYSVIPLKLPYILESISKYFISLSGALALLNVVPCYALDGQHILFALVQLLPQWMDTYRTPINNVVLSFGSILLGTNVLLAMYNVLF